MYYEIESAFRNIGYQQIKQGKCLITFLNVMIIIDLKLRNIFHIIFLLRFIYINNKLPNKITEWLSLQRLKKYTPIAVGRLN